MPYNLKKVGKGYKVMSPSGALSRKPLTKARAIRQMRAVGAAKHARGKYER
jgi:hypothetical protein